MDFCELWQKINEAPLSQYVKRQPQTAAAPAKIAAPATPEGPTYQLGGDHVVVCIRNTSVPGYQTIGVVGPMSEGEANRWIENETKHSGSWEKGKYTGTDKFYTIPVVNPNEEHALLYGN